MQNRPEVTAMLSLSIQRHICPNSDPRIYWAREVTFDYATTNAVRVDFMKFKPVNNTVSGIEKGDFYCYEVKSSVDDFHSKNGHNFLGDYNYYVMPEEVYEQVKKEIPYQVGVYVPDGMNYRGEWYGLKAIKKAKRKDRSRPVYGCLCATCEHRHTSFKKCETSCLCCDPDMPLDSFEYDTEAYGGISKCASYSRKKETK